jgi:aryl-alcohol dehydrogenase-like predicted oxidoreductase
MNFGASTIEADSIRIIHAALDGGINFVDTANSYNRGESEVITGKALKGRRDRVFLASKVRSEVGPGPNDKGLSRKHILQACDDTLRRLDTGYLDLYQLHRPEPDVDIEETLSALTDLVHAGKIRYAGSSTFPAWMVMEALATAEREHLVRLSSEQPPYNLLDRRIENELVPLALKYRVSIIPWAPLAQGMLAGRYKTGAAPEAGSRAVLGAGPVGAMRFTDQNFALGERFAELARQNGKTPGQLALLWCKDQPGITAPIFGPRTMEQLQDALPVLEMNLSEAERKACDELNPPGTATANFHSADWMKMKVA